MTNADKTKQQLIEELEGLRLSTVESEKLEAERKPVEESKTKARRTVHMSITGKIALLGIGLAAFYWMLDSAIHAFVFHEGTLIEAILFPGYHGIWERLLVVCLLVVFSVYAQFIINNRKRAEEGLRSLSERESKSAREWQELFDASTDVIALISPDFEILRINRAGRAGYEGIGKKQEELIGKKCYEVLHGLDSPIDGCPCQDLIRTKKAGVGEFTQGGRHYIATASPVLDKNGELIAFAHIVKDITERKRAEKELQESQEKLWSMFESITDGLLVTDLNGVIIEINEKAVEMHGFGSRDELLGESAIELVAPHDHKRIATNMRRAIKQGQIRDIEYTLLKADGTEFPSELSTNVLKDASGNLVGHITLARDITERKRMEKALEESERKYRTMIETANDLIWILDAEGNFTFLNRKAEEASGYKAEDWLGKGFAPLIYPPEDLPRIQKVFLETMKGRGQSYEVAVVSANGSVFHLSVNTAPIYHQGQVVGTVSFGRDITERKRMEAERKELEQKAQLASRLATVGEMTSGIAHEINNPLTAVIGFAQLVMDKNIPDDIREDIDIIYSEAQRTAEVVKNLLTFARKHAPASQLTNINSVVEDILKLRAYEHRVNNIQVNTRLDPKLPEIMVDYFQMQQVFLNIILNGETAMLEAHNKGTLTITTQKVNSTIKVSFTDDGPGIAEENLSRIFDPFFTTREVGKGTGLGLSICHGIVAEHGGRIYARSKLGKGATFVVELPINAD